MQFIRVNCLKGTLTVDQKAKLAPLLVEALRSMSRVLVEIPKGSWGAVGQTIDREKISKLIGAPEGPERLAEVKEIAARMKAARLS
jgi:phenylpyruvate tautomerase PptA (4-oxalocrotonate tautomerase family)